MDNSLNLQSYQYKMRNKSWTGKDISNLTVTNFMENR